MNCFLERPLQSLGASEVTGSPTGSLWVHGFLESPMSVPIPVLDWTLPLFLVSKSFGLLFIFVPEARTGLGFSALGLWAQAWD